MNRPPKKHHFVTQAQLRHFAADPERRSIYVFDKRSGKSFLTSILNAGSENDFNTVSFDGGEWNFEHLFGEVDARSARLIAEIVERRSVGWLGAEDRVALADLFATQLLRTHFSRTTPKHLAGQLREVIRQIGYDPDQDPAIAMPSEAALRMGAAKAFLKRGDHVASLLRLVPSLFAPSGSQRLVLSDHPVSRTNAFPYGDVGLTSHGVIVGLPIAPDLSLNLICPTIVARYEALDKAELDPERRERLLCARDALRAGLSVEMDDVSVDASNRQQLAQSGRFLYSATDEFDWARDLLGEHPQLRSIEAHIKLGEMGRGPPPKRGMPKGLQLVVQGPHDHCMLPLAEIEEAGEGITARTTRPELLALVAADHGMLSVELYENGHVRRGMRETMIERFGEPNVGWFRAVHRDEAMRALGALLDGDGRDQAAN
jgi:hypothetical protein